MTTKDTNYTNLHEGNDHGWQDEKRILLVRSAESNRGDATIEGGFIDFGAQGAEVSQSGVAGVGFAFWAGGGDLLPQQLLARVAA